MVKVLSTVVVTVTVATSVAVAVSDVMLADVAVLGVSLIASVIVRTRSVEREGVAVPVREVLNHISSLLLVDL